MATRLIRYVGRTSGEAMKMLEDGTVVHRDEVAEVDVQEARRLLREPGASDDSASEWVPEPRPEV